MELAHANRVATMGQLTASIAHEVNQPIAAAVNNAQAALRWLDAQNRQIWRRSGRRSIGSSRTAIEPASHRPDPRPHQESTSTEGQTWRSTKRSSRSSP